MSIIHTHDIVAGSTGDIMGVMDFLFPNGTQPLGTGSQMCLNISITDDQIVEPTEIFTLCGSSQQNRVVFLNNGCSDISIRDNDGNACF